MTKQDNAAPVRTIREIIEAGQADAREVMRAAKFAASDQAVNGSRYARAMQLQIDRPSELDNATWRKE